MTGLPPVNGDTATARKVLNKIDGVLRQCRAQGFSEELIEYVGLQVAASARQAIEAPRAVNAPEANETPTPVVAPPAQETTATDDDF